MKPKKLLNHIYLELKNYIVKIGRFAISREYSNQGIGSHIVRHIILNLINLSEKELGLRFILWKLMQNLTNFINIITLLI